eukprot:13465995-Ditylum_brightwellii.AAC.1
MGPTGRYGPLAAPLMIQTTKFPPGNLARWERAYVLPPLPPCRELLIVYGDHIFKILTYAKIRTIADPAVSSPRPEPRSTAMELHSHTN